MIESRKQHDLIMWFGQSWPEYRRLLFMVHNETENFKQRMYRKSMGQIAGVSDLILMLPMFGLMAGIELKAPNSTHKTEHIKRQLEWGQKVIDNGGLYIMSSNIEEVKKYIYNWIKGHFICPNLDHIQNQLKNKTIKF